MDRWIHSDGRAVAKLKVIAEDPDDDRVLECAVASGSDVIVTGDKDLLRRGEYEGIRIMRAADFLRERIQP